MSGLMKVFKEGDIIFREGNNGRTFYYIQKGKVEISKMVAGKKTIVNVLNAGNVFGELALLRDIGNIRSATASVLEESVLIVLDEEALSETLKEVPSFVLNSLKDVVNKLLSIEKQFYKMQEKCYDFNLLNFVELLFENQDSLPNKFPIYLKKYTPNQRKEVLDSLENIIKVSREKYQINP